MSSCGMVVLQRDAVKGDERDMSSMSPRLNEAWTLVTALPSPERRVLVEKLLQESTEAGEAAVVVVLRRFDHGLQARLDELFTKSNEGTLTVQERAELTTLVDDYERIMLTNTEALLRAGQPQFFDAAGRVVRSRLSRAGKRLARSRFSS